MRRVRIIPVLLLDSAGGLVKTVRFGKRTYIGDPINAVRIFNDKGVDELILLDIDATREGREPSYSLIEDIAGEAFMPVGYGGGITSVAQIQQLLRCGLEKVVLSTAAHENPRLVRDASRESGSQSVVVCVDVKRSLFGPVVVTRGGGSKIKLSPQEAASRAVEAGAGELIVQSVDRDGTFCGYDESLLASITCRVPVPVIALGGARTMEDFHAAVAAAGCSAAAAGSKFVYQGIGRGILISYPSELELGRLYESIAA